ncbi:MAG TPA: rRNA maturation RNase YbeY [Candidatus Angelobacter sp.]|nr:rRNA maturation RNase YbeY [Candidatus Angelobacter sp.]
MARRPLEAFLRRVKRELGLAKSEVTVCLVSDADMAQLNRYFLKKKGPTDVLSFPQENSYLPLACPEPRRATCLPRVPPRGHSPLRRRKARKTANLGKQPRLENSGTTYLGDIAISPATARRYAKKNARKLTTELRVLILHGVLHLLGFDHETDHGEMDRAEQKLCKRLGIA